jgi:3-oxoacyl-(acyl-carrier-protein) synthase
VIPRGRGSSPQVTLGSVKSCYGHTEGTAGLTGALLAIQTLHKQVLSPLSYTPYFPEAINVLQGTAEAFSAQAVFCQWWSSP